MKLKSEKTARLIFWLMFTCIGAYILYIILSYYGQDRKSEVELSFKADETNIITNVHVEYSAQITGGQLILETNEETSSVDSPEVKGKPFLIRNEENKVKNAELSITYDDKYVSGEEKNLRLAKLSDDGKLTEYKSVTDTEKNIINAKISEEGIWCIIE